MSVQICPLPHPLSPQWCCPVSCSSSLVVVSSPAPSPFPPPLPYPPPPLPCPLPLPPLTSVMLSSILLIVSRRRVFARSIPLPAPSPLPPSPSPLPPPPTPSHLSDAVQYLAHRLSSSCLRPLHRLQLDEHRVYLRHDAADRVLHPVHPAWQHCELFVWHPAPAAPTPQPLADARPARAEVVVVAVVDAVVEADAAAARRRLARRHAGGRPLRLLLQLLARLRQRLLVASGAHTSNDDMKVKSL